LTGDGRVQASDEVSATQKAAAQFPAAPCMPFSPA
jgi:hypothetical protein